MIATEHRVVIKGAAFYEDRYRRGEDGRWRIAHTGYVRTYEAMLSLDDLPSFRFTAKLGARAQSEQSTVLTQPFAEALAEAEKIIAGAPHVASEQDLAEGYDYLAGSIQASLRLAWAYQRDFPFFVASTGPYTKMGLDNPDTLYFHAYLRDDAEYVVTGRRGTTADLSFQVLNGDYSPVEVPDSLSAFDDRELDIAADGTFELRFGPAAGGQLLHARAGSAMLLVREVYSDWAAERRGMIGIRRADRAGSAPPAAADTERAGQAVRRGGQDPALPAADLPGVSRVVLPQRAGQHADRAPPHARRAGHPVLLGRALRPRRRPGDDRDRARRGQGDRAVPGHPARQHVVRLAGLHQPPDQPDRRPGPHRPGRPDAVRDQRARPRRGQLAGATGHRRGLRPAPLAAADPGPRTADGPVAEVFPSADLPAAAATTTRPGSPEE